MVWVAFLVRAKSAASGYTSCELLWCSEFIFFSGSLIHAAPLWAIMACVCWIGLWVMLCVFWKACTFSEWCSVFAEMAVPSVSDVCAWWNGCTFCAVWSGSLGQGPNTGPWSFTVRCSSFDRRACSSSDTIRKVPVCGEAWVHGSFKNNTWNSLCSFKNRLISVLLTHCTSFTRPHMTPETLLKLSDSD